MNPAFDSSYQALLERVRRRELRLLLVLSPPRTGSTALAKALCQRFHVDAQLIEPAAQFLAGDERVSEMFKTLLRAVESLETGAGATPRNTAHPPRVVLVKEISQHIGPAEEWRAWQRLFERTLVLVRQPSLALESLLLMTLGLVELLLGREEARPQSWLSPPHAHLLPASATDSWASLAEHLRRSRDFRCLGSDRFRAFWYESCSLLGTHSLQTEIWTHAVGQHRLSRSPQDLAAYAGTPASRLSTLPRDLLRPLADRHFGWSAMRDLWEGVNPSDSSIAVADFGPIQMEPDAMLEEIGHFLGLAPSEQDGAREHLQATGYSARERVLPGISSLLFGNAKAQDRILPQQKEPLASELFPEFLREQLADAEGVYGHLMRDHRRFLAGRP
jgi:hypothetical protein